MGRVGCAGTLIDLSRSRDLGGILGGAFRLYLKRFGVFAVIAFAVVVPVDLLVYGIAGEWLWTDPGIEGSMPVGATVAAAVVLAGLGATLGLVLLIVPGVYLWARWFLAAQAVVAEGLGPTEALSRSADLVRGHWWRIFGIALVITLLAAILAALIVVPLQLAGDAAGSGPLVLLGQIIGDAVALSFAALAGTLLFFDARARKQGAFAPSPPPPDLEAPERPT